MANPVLHIKDSYYFEVPKVLYPSDHKSLSQFPDVWVRLDPEFQEWEFHRQYEALTTKIEGSLAPQDLYHHSWREWVESDHAHHGKPFDVFVEENLDAQVAAWQAAKVARLAEVVAPKQDADAKIIREMEFDAFLSNPNSLGVKISHPE